MATSHYDVLVIGAGISGINAAYRIQEGMPDYSYAILEARNEIGGTWSFFKYPGIRSDSDLFTFGFAWDPWNEDQAIATAPSILKYLKQVSARHGIDRHLKLNHKTVSMEWSSELQRWDVEVLVDEKETRVFQCRFLAIGTGYYDYQEGLETTIPNISCFKGKVVHPQFWPENLDYTDKSVVIIGSGATAVTILPAIAAKTAQVTMLQRSPGYFVSIPENDSVNTTIKKYFPASWAGWLLRLKFLFAFHTFYYWCMLFPATAYKKLREAVAKELPAGLDIDPHFKPAYAPWEQRMCVAPGGDFFQALRSGKATVVTDTIRQVTQNGIELGSGQTLPADIIITATGLKFQLLGHAKLKVDGEEVDVGQKYLWRGCMLQDVPNLALFMGYTNASWTLGSDATARLVVRIMRKLRQQRISSATATVEANSTLDEVPMLGLKSSYVKRAIERNIVPRCASTGPWRPRRSYFFDSWFASYGNLSGLKFGPQIATSKKTN